MNDTRLTQARICVEEALRTLREFTDDIEMWQTNNAVALLARVRRQIIQAEERP